MTSKLMVAILFDNLAHVDDLITHGVSVDSKFTDGTESSALHFATNLGRRSIVSFLLNNGANPNVQNIMGYTPLHCAIMQARKSTEFDSYIAIAKELLEYNADSCIKSYYGHSSLEKAYEDPKIYQLLFRKKSFLNFLGFS